MLGKCYEHLGQPDQEYGAYRRVLTEDRNDPLWFPAAEGVARSLLALNRLDEALEAYRRLLPRTPAARVVLIRLLIVQNLGKPEAERRWGEVDRLLAEPVRLECLDLTLVRVEVLTARSRFAEAKDLLAAESPDDIRVILARAQVAETEEGITAALAVLDDAEVRFGDRIAWRLARVQQALRLSSSAAVEMLAKLEANTTRLSEADRQLLLVRLAEAYAARGAPAEARRVWEQVVREQGDNLEARLQLFELALQTQDDQAALLQLREIRRLDGEKGIYWRYCAASRSIALAERGDRTGLNEARRLLGEVAKRRPSWPRLAVCEARIEELSGNNDQALRQYLRAVELGERRPSVLLQASCLLGERGRSDEAQRMLQKVPEFAVLRSSFP
jgi:tetratricopeptide (TPR) repeat protein